MLSVNSHLIPKILDWFPIRYVPKQATTFPSRPIFAALLIEFIAPLQFTVTQISFVISYVALKYFITATKCHYLFLSKGQDKVEKDDILLKIYSKKSITGRDRGEFRKYVHDIRKTIHINSKNTVDFNKCPISPIRNIIHI